MTETVLNAKPCYPSAFDELIEDMDFCDCVSVYRTHPWRTGDQAKGNTRRTQGPLLWGAVLCNLHPKHPATEAINAMGQTAPSANVLTTVTKAPDVRGDLHERPRG